MNITINKGTPEEKELQITKYHRTPAWVFDFESCNKCGINFYKLPLHSVAFAAMDSTGYQFRFCERCWEGREVQ